MSDYQQQTLPLFPETRSRFDLWAEFHEQNPKVFELFRHFAEQALTKGNRKHFGARMIFERIRWYTSVEIQDDCEWVLNNNHFPYYARLLMAVDDRFDGFFECRDSRFDATVEQIVDAHDRAGVRP